MYEINTKQFVFLKTTIVPCFISNKSPIYKLLNDTSPMSLNVIHIQ